MSYTLGDYTLGYPLRLFGLLGGIPFPSPRDPCTRALGDKNGERHKGSSTTGLSHYLVRKFRRQLRGLGDTPTPYEVLRQDM